jgi:hypothetical protein
VLNQFVTSTAETVWCGKATPAREQAVNGAVMRSPVSHLSKVIGAALLALGALGLSSTASAALVAPTSGALGGLGSHTLTLTGQITAANSTDTGSNPLLTLPDSYHYGDTLGPLDTAVAGTSYEFYDAYVFTIDSAVASTVTTTINLGGTLGLSGIQERLYSANVNDSVPYTGPGQPPFASTYFLGWTTVLGSTGEVAVLESAPLTAGIYVLEIRGNVTGTSGGSYAGVLNVVPAAPVPLPAGLPLLFSGLVSLGGLVRRRMN